ncbi:hypothetical protein E1295_45585 [Nonomuraea mesophila]|uniref:Uncharacterized protein n=1 Tax=Nonomuraea mesophila TaxID=2530382 RepID=A0A4R5E4Q0_9ACTN|nr:hypothetical protein [Nonomuraea mesophila]TDE23992.1 hypothetical protein E1295_45585 [Nonomuraea mesophila]
MRSRSWAALAAALAALLLTAQPASARATVEFAADSGDRCRHGVTEGTLEWVEGPVIRPAVQVEGTLSDSDPLSICAPDDMHSVVTFTAYHGDTVVASGTQKADDATVKVSLGLSDATGVTSIERVVVQVCRYTNSPIGTGYCGEAAEYKMP